MNDIRHKTRLVTFILSAVLSMLFPGMVYGAPDGGDLCLKTVVIDPGHGGRDPGCISRDGKVYEKNLNLDVAKRLGAKISAAYPDVRVVYTRSTDVFIPLNTRADIANRNNANLFISIHTNGWETSQPHGFSTHIFGNNMLSSNQDLVRRENSVILLEEDYSINYQGFDPNDPESYIFFNLMQNANYEQSLAFAADVDKELSKGPVTYNRGISQNAFIVLWKATVPAVLVEMGFISNSSDLKILTSPTRREEIAGRLFDAFRNFKTRYDASLDYETESVPDPHSGDGSRQQAQPDMSSDDGYGVQIFALSKLLEPGDSAFKGYDAVAVKSGNIYKYIIRESSADAARTLFRKVRKTFPGSFPVRIEDGAVSAL